MFDTDPAKVGRSIGSLAVTPYPIRDTVRDRNIIVGVIAVPADAAQDAADDLVTAGVKIVFNYSEALLDTRRAGPA